VPFLRLFLVLFTGQPNVTLLAEKRLEVVAWNHLLILFQTVVYFIHRSLIVGH
jgi:hypothetical protein